MANGVWMAVGSSEVQEKGSLIRLVLDDGQWIGKALLARPRGHPLPI